MKFNAGIHTASNSYKKPAMRTLRVLNFGGLGRNRTDDTRIFNPKNAIFGRFFTPQGILNHSPIEIT